MVNFEKYEGSFDQNQRFGIKFNSHIPTKHKWYAIIDGDYLGITEGETLISDAEGRLITSLKTIPESLAKLGNKK